MATGELGMGDHDGFPAVTADADVLVNRNLAEEGRLRALRQLFAAARAEDVHARAVRQVEVGHVLDHAQDGHFQLAEHHQAAAGIFERDQLRQGDDDRAAEGQGLREREGRVAGARAAGPR